MHIGRSVKPKLKTRIKCNMRSEVTKSIDRVTYYLVWWQVRSSLRNNIFQIIGRAVLWRREIQ